MLAIKALIMPEFPFYRSLLLGIVIAFLMSSQGCTQKTDPEAYTAPDAYLLIETGAQTTSASANILYNVRLIGQTGIGTTPKPGFVSWSVSPENLGTFNGSVFTAGTTNGTGTITATYNALGQTLTATAPINVIDSKRVFPFEVFPSCLLKYAGAASLNLRAFYFGESVATFTYTSNHPDIASVDANGTLTFKAIGEAQISVGARIMDQDYVFKVPVMVKNLPPAYVLNRRLSLPDCIVLFRSDSARVVPLLTDDNGNKILLPYKALTWSVRAQDTLNNRFYEVNKSWSFPAIITPDSLGNIVANRPGRVFLYARTRGMVAQTEVMVMYDTVSQISPEYQEVMQNPASLPTAYFRFFTVNRELFKSGAGYGVTPVQYGVSTAELIKPSTGNSTLDSELNLDTLVHADANGANFLPKPGKLGNTYLYLSARGKLIKPGISNPVSNKKDN
jgi:hypothetical protein